MSKKGMARPDWTHTKPKNEVSPVPEIQGKAKHGNKKANPVISSTQGANLKVFHTTPPLPKKNPAADNDLGSDNLLNDLPAADLQDF